MKDDHDFFTPEHIDEQIAGLSGTSHISLTSHNESSGEPVEAESALVADLKAYYQSERQEDKASLARSWERISAHLHEERENTQPFPSRMLSPSTPGIYQERIHRMQNTVSHKGKLSRQFSLLVAVLVSALVVGGLVAVLNLSHQKSSGNTASPSGVQSQKKPTATATPPPVWGKTLYTTPANQVGFESLSWSPNSKRVASATVDNKGVQIWDATTGGHLITVQFPNSDEGAYDLDWSPDSENVAVATNQHVLIVNGQTGAVIIGQTAGRAITQSANSGGRTALSDLLPASGGLGYRAVAWSPKGNLLAAARSFGPSGEVEVWVPKTDHGYLQFDTVNFTLSLGSSDNIGSLSWSADGRYLAASVWNTQPVDMKKANSRVVVWDTDTRQIVFQHSDFLSGDASLVWQPQSHNLAFIGEIASGSTSVLAIEIWDVMANKLVKHYAVVGNSSALAWSPDGAYLAYAGFAVKDSLHYEVIVIDAITGKQIYAYTGHHRIVSVISWSPDGKYIASGEGNTDGQMVAKVWTAA